MPKTWVTMFGTHEFSYQLTCDFAAIVGFMIVASIRTDQMNIPLLLGTFFAGSAGAIALQQHSGRHFTNHQPGRGRGVISRL